ncbi:MAG: hypothetical protein EBV73_05050, partial [Rhodocyclales bacterium]|nr:hypothetical protein [Rhodocyclales bacterium]
MERVEEATSHQQREDEHESEELHVCLIVLHAARSSQSAPLWRDLRKHEDQAGPRGRLSQLQKRSAFLDFLSSMLAASQAMVLVRICQVILEPQPATDGQEAAFDVPGSDVARDHAEGPAPGLFPLAVDQVGLRRADGRRDHSGPGTGLERSLQDDRCVDREVVGGIAGPGRALA